MPTLSLFHRGTAARRVARGCLALVVLGLLAGCRMDLHTKATEADANEMLGALLVAGVDARKMTPDGGKTWTINVEESHVVRAIDVLRVNGLPRLRHQSMGDLFKKEGLISSPTEERVRFIFGIQQELASTIGSIDGVMLARVHIVLPNNDPLVTQVRPSSASVFVKHRTSIDLLSLVPAIKNLVMHAVQGLSYDQVTVTLVAAEPEVRPKPATASEGGGAGLLAWLVPAMLLLVLLAAGVALKMGWIPRRWLLRIPSLRRAAPEPADTAGATAE
jgi:type III secretion protein J